MEEALFARDGDVYVPSERTRGPWSMEAQHAGPVAALAAGLIEDVDRDRGFAVVRITFELLRPLPLLPLKAAARAVNTGRSTDRVVAEVRDAASDELLVTATGLRLRRKAVTLPDIIEPDASPRPPEESEPADAGFLGDHTWFVKDAVETRIASGNAFASPGPATVWFRLRQPVVEGRPLTPIQRVCAAADSGNGISNLMD